VRMTIHEYGQDTRALLAMVKANGGEVETRIVASILHQAVLDEMLDEQVTPVGADGMKYTYRLMTSGRDWLDVVPAREANRIAQAMALIGKEHWRSLELAATVIYMKRRRRIESLEDALHLGLRLKPACEGYKAPARGLIEKLDIG